MLAPSGRGHSCERGSVPLYGWHVVPFDFAVGLGLAGLRLTSRSLVAPAAAHTVADLASWWL